MGLFDFLQPKGWTEQQQSQQLPTVEQEGLPFPASLLAGTYLQGRRLALAYKVRAFHVSSTRVLYFEE